MSCGSCILLWLLLLQYISDCHSQSQGASQIWLVDSVQRFQRAIREGVKHIVITQHLSTVTAQQELEGLGESLDTSIGNVLSATKSIVGNCAEPPSSTSAVSTEVLAESLPPNACVITVKEDFLELPVDYGRSRKELWLHNIYVVVQKPPEGSGPSEKSSTLILHKDGELYVTSSVFQGRDDFNRGIDVSQQNDGRPKLYVADTVFSGFRRDHAAAIRGNAGTSIHANRTTFRSCTVVPVGDPAKHPKWTRVMGAAVGLFDTALLWLQDVVTQDLVVLGQPAGSKAFSFESRSSVTLEEEEAAPRGIYARPVRPVWEYNLNVSVPAQPVTQLPNRFLSAGSILDGIQRMLIHVIERVHSLHEHGVVHRDLKPGNILWRPTKHCWTLIDFGCAAEMGETTSITFSLAYSAPETVRAASNGMLSTTATAGADIWAIGVIAYELVRGWKAFHALHWTQEEIVKAAQGHNSYPWEAAVGTFKRIPEMRVLSRAVFACLARNPDDRPTSGHLLKLMNALYDSHTTTNEE